MRRRHVSSRRVAVMTRRCRPSRSARRTSRTCSNGSITTARLRRPSTSSRTRAGKPRSPNLSHLQAEAPEQAADAIVDVTQLGHQQLFTPSATRAAPGRAVTLRARGRNHGSAGADPSDSCKERGQQAAEAGPNHVRNGTGIRSVRLDRHRPRRRPQLSGLQQHHRQPRRCQADMQHCDIGPASRPTRVKTKLRPVSAVATASGSVSTWSSWTMEPAWSTMQMPLVSSETSGPA